ncbi:hypothetical protein vseg_019189 [Gypsophila vaccaria]
MKPLISTEKIKDAFEFNVDDNPDDCDPWSKMIAKQSKSPNFDNADCNSEFIQKNSSRPVSQIREVPTVSLDDGRSCTNDSSAVQLDLPHNTDCQESEVFYSASDRVVEQRSGLSDSNVEKKSSPSCIGIEISSPLGPLPENGHDFPSIPESPCRNGHVQKSFPSTPHFELEEINVPSDGQNQCQSVGALDTDVKDTIVVYTDYVTYGDKYFPAARILFSRDSIEMKTPALEEEPAASSSEWKLDNVLKIDTRCTSMANVAKVRVQLLPHIATHTDVANETLGAVEVVEFLVTDWSHHQEQIMSLHVRYFALLNIGINMQSCNGDVVSLEDSECSSNPYMPNFEEPFEEVVYPKGEIDAVSVRKSDVDLLLPDVFVNDTIIDFYITYLKNGIPLERRRNFHFFSSFFFRKLADLDKNPSSISDGKAAFQRVRRWTRKVNIFEKDYVFIPVNYSLHWSLIVLCHPGEVANLNDENIDEALKVPCILHMDSIRGTHAGLKDLFQSYLLEEWKERQTETYEDVSSKFLNLRFLSLELPQQENCSDCGLFLLHYAELFIEESPQNFSPFQINEFDNFLKPDWFLPAEASLKRVHIQRLIYELLKSLSHESASPPRNSLSYFPELPVNKENNDTAVEIVSEKQSLQKSCNGSSLYSDPVRGMDMSRLDIAAYRPSNCIDSSVLGMSELLAQQCQRFDRGASLVQLGFSLSTTAEVEGNEHLSHSDSGQTGLHPIDEEVEFQIGCSSEDLFRWNSDFSDQGDPEDTSLSSSSHSCDDSTEEIRILECPGGIQSVSSCQNEKADQSKEVVDSQEGYISAFSDLMETPAQDSQELAEKFGSHDQEDLFLSNLEDRFEVAQEELGKTEDDGTVSILSVDDKLVVENGIVDNDDQEDPFRSDSEDRFEPSQVERGKTEDEGIITLSSVDEELVFEIGKSENHDQEEDPFLSNSEDRFEASQDELGKTEDEGIITLSSVDKEVVIEDSKSKSDDHKDPVLSKLEDKVEVSREELCRSEDEGTVSLPTVNQKSVVEEDNIKHDEAVAGAEAWVTDSPPDLQRPAKRLRVSSSPNEVEQLA